MFKLSELNAKSEVKPNAYLNALKIRQGTTIQAFNFILLQK